MVLRKQIAAVTVPATDRIIRIRDVNYFAKVPRNITPVAHSVTVAYAAARCVSLERAVRSRPSTEEFRSSDAIRFPANDRPNQNPCRHGMTARA